MDNFPRGWTAVVGAATYGSGEALGCKSQDLAAKAALKTRVDDVRMPLASVDALFDRLADQAVANANGGTLSSQAIQVLGSDAIH